MPASNALFWTSCGWDGSEQMIRTSVEFQVRDPSASHMDFLSFSTLETVIVTFQGAQALYALFNGLPSGGAAYGYSIAITTIFFPIPTFGLLRLPAAM
jgi:hypothetical protein